MSDEEDEGYKGPLHPRLTMDDITEVSGPEEIERKNTFQITKNTEARSKTVFSIIVGALAGLALCLIFAPLLGYMFSSFFVLLGGILAPFFAVGTIRDRTQQTRWKRTLQDMKSRKIEGQVFYPNSTQPENIIDLQEMEIR